MVTELMAGARRRGHLESGALGERVDVAVVGAGLVGLATAASLLESDPALSVAVIDKEPRVAAHQSGRNSGVLHAGLYYAPGSLKATLCKAGREAMIAFADAHGIPWKACGKLVVAADESELPRLAALADRGRSNGLALRELEGSELREIEPNVIGVRALHIPESGVIDYARVAATLESTLAAGGVRILLDQPVTAIIESGGRRIVQTSAGEVDAEIVVCCGGVQADRLAELTRTSTAEYRIVPFRGDYYSFLPHAESLVQGLVYPVPDPAFPFLGVHFTRGIGGDLRAGPNAVLALAREGYHRLSLRPADLLDTLRFPGFRRLAREYAKAGAAELWRDLVKPAYLAQMRRYLPMVASGDVRFGPSGIRAQCLRRDGSLVDDFLIEESRGVIHVLNAPSPAATASLVIGQRIAALALAQRAA
jgi:L-2-hydroxyglutarate oxidase LhgO